MGQGVEGYNPVLGAGPIFSETSYAGNFLGSFSTGGQASGSITDARMIGLRLVYFSPQNLSFYGGPQVTLNSSTGQISWNYAITVNGNIAAPSIPSETIYYGGY